MAAGSTKTTLEKLGPLPSLDDVMVSVSAQWDELSDAEKVVIGLILNRETVEQGTISASAVSRPEDS